MALTNLNSSCFLKTFIIFQFVKERIMEKSETVEYKNSLLNPSLKIITFNNLMYFLMPRIYSYIYIFYYYIYYVWGFFT